MSAEALDSRQLCGTEVAVVPQYGKKDTIIKSLLVEVSNPAYFPGHYESIKTMVSPVDFLIFR